MKKSLPGVILAIIIIGLYIWASVGIWQWGFIEGFKKGMGVDPNGSLYVEKINHK